MVREDFVTLAMTPADGESWSLPYLQRLLFLLDTRIAGLGGPHFTFAPYDYGPLSAEVRPCLEHMRHSGLVLIEGGGWMLCKARLTWKGQEHGRALISAIPEKDAEHVRRHVAWVRSLSFGQLSAAMQTHFPDMCTRAAPGVETLGETAVPCS